jgi:hypothetical protein
MGELHHLAITFQSIAAIACAALPMAAIAFALVT